MTGWFDGGGAGIHRERQSNHETLEGSIFRGTSCDFSCDGFVDVESVG